MKQADVRFVFQYHTITATVDCDGTYEDAVQQAMEILHGEGVSTDGAHDIEVLE